VHALKTVFTSVPGTIENSTEFLVHMHKLNLLKIAELWP